MPHFLDGYQEAECVAAELISFIYLFFLQAGHSSTEATQERRVHLCSSSQKLELLNAAANRSVTATWDFLRTNQQVCTHH